LIDIVLTILPVFLVLVAGYAGARTGYLSAAIADPLNAFAVRLAVPLLLFRAMYGLDFSQAFDPAMLAAFYLGGILSFAGGVALARLVFARRPGEAIAVGFCALFSNTVMLGLPIVERAWGAAALPPTYAIVALHAPVMYAIGMVAMELARRDGRTLGAALRSAGWSILGNPLMLGIIAGAALNLAGLPLPEPVVAAVDMVASAAIPTALIGIGVALARYRLKSELAESLMVAFLSLVVHPAATLALSWWVFGADPDLVRVAVLVAAMPPGMNVYIFAMMYDRAVSLAASSVLVATVLSVLSISVWIAILGAVLPG